MRIKFRLETASGSLVRATDAEHCAVDAEKMVQEMKEQVILYISISRNLNTGVFAVVRCMVEM